MAILNFCGFETGNLIEVFTGMGSPAIVSKTDNNAVTKSGEYSLFISGDTGQAGVYFGEIASGVYRVMNRQRIFVRFYFYVAAMPADSTEIFAIKDTDDNIKLSLRLKTTGELVLNGFSEEDSISGEEIGVADELLEGAWYRIEVKCQITGAYEVKVNNVSKLSGTDDFGDKNIALISLGNPHDTTIDSDHALYYDDFKMSNTEYPGASYTANMPVIYDGHHVDWSGVYTGVTEPFDDEYIVGTDAEVSTFELDDLSDEVYEDIICIKVIATVKAATGEDAKVKPVLRTASSDFTINDPTQMLPDDGYVTIGAIFEVNPDTDDLWTLEELNNLEAGVQTTNDTSTAYCDYITVGVDYY